MRSFKKSFDDEEVDLDNPHTYDHLPKETKQLDNMMFYEIGYALCYMNNFHSDVFKGKRDGGQRKRVLKLIEYFCNEQCNHYNDVPWFQEQLFIFQDETENMCYWHFQILKHS